MIDSYRLEFLNTSSNYILLTDNRSSDDVITLSENLPVGLQAARTYDIDLFIVNTFEQQWTQHVFKIDWRISSKLIFSTMNFADEGCKEQYLDIIEKYSYHRQS
jgi:hypothetical protein